MDFERAAIKTLFYDYPVETAIQVMNSPKDTFLDVFSDITRWRESEFTVSEWKLLERILNDDWLKGDSFGQHKNLSNSLDLLAQVANKLLTLDVQRKPVVSFEQLFRWHEVSQMIGEDTLILAFLANRDLNDAPYAKKRELYLWSDIVHHDNVRLNTLLEVGAADVHSHFNATADIFHLNWISMMNSVNNNFKTIYFEHYQNVLYLQPTMSCIYSHRALCLAAAYLRELLYREIVLGGMCSNEEWNLIQEILNGTKDEKAVVTIIQGAVLNLNDKALRIYQNSQPYDYAIPNDSVIKNHKDNIQILYHGERDLLYKAFYKWYSHNLNDKTSSYFYLYLLIKTHIRRELVELNTLHGFDNFAEMQRRKQGAVNELGKFIASKFIVQGTLSDNNDTLETRVVPEQYKEVLEQDYGKSVFSDALVIPSPKDRMSLVVHFLKRRDSSLHQNGVDRYADYRKKMREVIDELIHTYSAQDVAEEQKKIRIVGIDAAGSELMCRPEVYAHVFRYAKRRGMLGRTYHVGEDFYDLVDGLRAVDEAITFLDLDNHSRIGHALALSIDATRYYQNRHYNIICSKQALLDNCVWLYFKSKEYNLTLPGHIDIFLADTAMAMYHDIGYKEEFSILHYWHSMILRGDDMTTEHQSEIWNEEKVQKTKSAVNARNDIIANRLWVQYLSSQSIKERGNCVGLDKWPLGIERVVSQLQDEMIRIIAEKGIAIECCPSSNLKIGRFGRYDEHPIFKFRPIDKDTHMPLLNVSINTDDRGVFATSLYNEYSLIALAMMKMKDENGHRKYNDETVYDYIERIRLNGQQQRFK